MGNPTPPKERPMKPAPAIRVLPKGSPHIVCSGESWVNLAQPLGIDPWDLIDFNFPGIKQVKRLDFRRATRQINWYLSEYVGCVVSIDGGNNFAFSDNLTGGKGDFKGGVIFLPPSGCAVIQIPSLVLPLELQAILARAKIQLPTSARCLDPNEVLTAKGIYGNSLDYGDIYISNAIGADRRPFTVALPLGAGWIVVLNLGQDAFDRPNSDRRTLIHEMAHAWQSQHHSVHWRFVVNCLESQLAASAATGADWLTSDRRARYGWAIAGVNVDDFKLGLGRADAYSYVPGQLFGEYGGEQIAQQVEDYFMAPVSPNGRGFNSGTRGQISPIVTHMQSVPAGALSTENVQSLGHINYAHERYSGVVWHGDDQ